MRSFVLAIYLGVSCMCSAQYTVKESNRFTRLSRKLKPRSVELSYLGKAVTHPGLKVGASYHFIENYRNGAHLGPSIGVFHHKNYQTALLGLTELSYSRKYVYTGCYVMMGIGAGYMRTFLSNVSDPRVGGELRKTQAGTDYILTNYFIRIGKKDMSSRIRSPLYGWGWYIKPQFMYMVPSTSKELWYFALEIGVSYRFKRYRRPYYHYYNCENAYPDKVTPPEPIISEPLP